jgi:hypothetical protein
VTHQSEPSEASLRFHANSVRKAAARSPLHPLSPGEKLQLQVGYEIDALEPLDRMHRPDAPLGFPATSMDYG